MFKIVTFIIVLVSTNGESKDAMAFPKDFIFGVSSSSQQIEGAWDVDGKGETMWDHFGRNYPEKVEGKTNIDVSCDSYYKTEEDIRLLKDLHVDFYRFSINWARILPTGFSSQINQAGIDYYSNLIDELLANGITPMVTIYHWELPQKLSILGGFANDEIVTWIEDYARILFENFGSRVKFWISINEPRIMCEYGYGNGLFAPAVDLTGIGDYLCEHNALKAHARIYHLYQTYFKQIQQGQVGICIDAQWYEPATDSVENAAAAERVRQFQFGKYLHTIFTDEGDYPQLLKERLEEQSKLEGYSKSRLPQFTPDEINLLKKSSDFLALNHYTTFLVRNNVENSTKIPSRENDLKADLFFDPSWEDTAFEIFKVVPWGFRKLLKYIKNNYKTTNIYITENGFADVHSIKDTRRVNYLKLFLSTVLDSIYDDKVSIKGYFVWSFLDSYEWSSGYTFGFGLHYVDFSDTNRTRIAKDSAKYYSNIIRKRKIILKDEL